MPRKNRSLDLTEKNEMYVKEKDLEDKMAMIKETDVGIKKGRKRLETIVAPPEEEEVEEEPVVESQRDASDAKKRGLEKKVAKKVVAKKVEEPVEEKIEEKVEEKPSFDPKGYIDEMFKGYLENLKKPVEVVDPNIAKKKGGVKKTVAKSAPVPKKEKVVKAQKSVMEVNNEDMMRMEYEREIRKRMMNSLFDY